MLAFWLFFAAAIEPRLTAMIVETAFASYSPLAGYFIPFFPLVTRGITLFRFRKKNVRREPLTIAEMARESTRQMILALAGFSFTGVLAIAVLDTLNRNNFKLQVFYLLISFLCYLIALNLQDYKFFLVRELISATLIDIATLSLICAAVSVVFIVGYDLTFQVLVFMLGLFGWTIDHLLRISYTWRVFKLIEKGVNDGTRDTGASVRGGAGGSRKLENGTIA